MDESIRLDRKSFEALAGQTRVRILKSLLKRRKTLTELSHELGLSASTTKEHLEVLVDSELAQQVDEGRKWKYYELTRKGKSIVQPHELKVLIVLGLSLIAAGAALFNLFYALQAPHADLSAIGFGAVAASQAAVSGDAPRAMAASDPNSSDAVGAENAFATEGTGQEEFASAEQAAPIPFLEAGITAAALLLLIWAFAYARGNGVL